MSDTNARRYSTGAMVFHWVIAVLVIANWQIAERAEALDMPAPMLAASIPNCNLTATTASKARAPLEAMFNLMQEGNPDILGGKLPDDGFYAL